MGLLDAPVSRSTIQALYAGDPALRSWRAGLANRNAGCDVLCIGDSITEGQGAAIGTRWVDRFRDGLRSRYPLTTSVAGGSGYLPSYYRSTGYTSPATAGSPAQDGSFGIGRRDLPLTTSGQTVTFTFTGTSFKLFTGRNSTTGSFSYTVDGGSATTVSGTNSQPMGGFVGANVTGLTAGSHTVVVAWVSGTTYIEGIFAYNGDEATGIRLWEAGSYGFASSSVAVNYFWAGTVSTIQPSLVTIELGVNDMTQGVSSATFQSNISGIISNVKSKCTVIPSFVLIALYQRASTFTEPWSNYLAAMRTVAAADPNNVTVFDLTQRMDAAGNGNTLGLYNVDLLHPSPKGHALIADSLLGFVGPR